MRIVICGGGIGGACAALALQGRGIEAAMLERRDGPGDSGAGLQLAPNATRLLRALGLEAALRACCLAPEAVELRDGHGGATGWRVPLGSGLAQRCGAPYLLCHRSDLLALLWRRLERWHSR